jgi:hypothetical protein
MSSPAASAVTRGDEEKAEDRNCSVGYVDSPEKREWLRRSGYDHLLGRLRLFGRSDHAQVVQQPDDHRRCVGPELCARVRVQVKRKTTQGSCM